MVFDKLIFRSGLSMYVYFDYFDQTFFVWITCMMAGAAQLGKRNAPRKLAAESVVTTLVVCAFCQRAKRKCDGNVPCIRCIARGAADNCAQPLPKKRGRPPKEGSPTWVAQRAALSAQEAHEAAATTLVEWLSSM